MAAILTRLIPLLWHILMTYAGPFSVCVCVCVCVFVCGVCALQAFLCVYVCTCVFVCVCVCVVVLCAFQAFLFVYVCTFVFVCVCVCVCVCVQMNFQNCRLDSG